MTENHWSAERIATLAFTQFIDTGNGNGAGTYSEAASFHIEQLCNAICQQFCEHRKAKEAIASLRQGDRDKLTRLVTYLQDEMEDNQAFALKLHNHVQQFEVAKSSQDSGMSQVNQDETTGFQTRVEGGRAYISDDLYIADNSTLGQYNAGSSVGSQADTVQGNVINYNFFGRSQHPKQERHTSSNGASATPHNIPRSHGSFVNRVAEIAEAHKLLKEQGLAVITDGLQLAGLGKTELAKQYCFKHLKDYPGGICWVFPDREPVMGLQIVQFVRVWFPDVEIPTTLSLENQVMRCWQSWPKGDGLVVMDDATDYEAIEPYLPTDARFKVLITASNTAKFPVGRSHQILLEGLSPDEAVLLLSNLLGEEVVNQEPEFAQKLCAFAGYSPLSLHTIARCRKPEGVSC